MTEGTTPEFAVDFTDQAGFFDRDSYAGTVTIIGLGGIGASIIPTLVTMGFEDFEIWDPDVVEPRNIASQLLYRPCDLFRFKAEVCKEYLLAYGAKNVRIVKEFFTTDSPLKGGIVISGVDTMAARKVIWEAIKAHQEKCETNLDLSPVDFYLDGRIGGLQMSLFGVEPFDGDWYERKWLFSDEEAAELPCGQRAIVFPAVALGAIMASYLMNYLQGEMPPKRVDFHLGTLFFQTVGKRD